MRKTKYRNLWARILKHKWLYVCILPGFMLMFLFSYVPLYGLLGAFQDYDPFKGFVNSPWVGLKNFRQLFALPKFYQVLKNTIRIGFWSFVFSFPAPIVLALLFNEVRSAKFKKMVQTISYIPHFISWVVASGIIMKFLALDGPINDLLTMLGNQERILFFGETKWFLPIVIISNIWKGVGFGSILYLAALTNIDPGLYEAADIDGASKMQKIRHVTIPGIMPIVMLQMVLGLAGLLNVNFDQVYTMQNTMNMAASDIIDTYTFRIAMSGSIDQYSRGIATGLFRAIICFLLFAIGNTISKKLGNGSVV